MNKGYVDYSNPATTEDYAYATLEEIINNFMAQYVGDHKVLNNVTRSNVIYAIKTSLQKFHFNVLKEIKGVELQLGELLEIRLPEDYVNFVRISWLNEQTGQYIPFAENKNSNPFVHGYLQDNNSEILYDSQGDPLEGTSFTNIINDTVGQRTATIACGGSCHDCYCGLNTTVSVENEKTYNIDLRSRRIHFSSNALSNAVILEYLSDGLEYADTGDIKINKLAEQALMDMAYANLLDKERGVNLGEKRSARKDSDTSYHNAKLAIGINIKEIANVLRGKRNIPVPTINRKM
jgi:hypothetical protein